MSAQIKIRRGLLSQIPSETPGLGEPLFAKDYKRLFVGDGNTPGGFQIGDFTGPNMRVINVSDSTSSVNAYPNWIMNIDTSSGVVTVVLPEYPLVGDQIRIYDAANNFGTNNVVLDRNGKRIDDAESNVLLDNSSRAYILFYGYNTGETNATWILSYADPEGWFGQSVETGWRYEEKTSAGTINVSESWIMNPAAPIDVNTPSNPSLGDKFQIIDRYGVFSGNPVTIKYGSELIDGQSSDYSIAQDYAVITFIYDINAAGALSWEPRVGLDDYLSIGSTSSATEYFTELLDTPASYSGNAGRYIRVNATASGLEFSSIVGGDSDLIFDADHGVIFNNEGDSETMKVTYDSTNGYNHVEISDDLYVTGTGGNAILVANYTLNRAELYYDGSKKLETTTTGIQVYDDVTAVNGYFTNSLWVGGTEVGAVGGDEDVYFNIDHGTFYGGTDSTAAIFDITLYDFNYGGLDFYEAAMIIDGSKVGTDQAAINIGYVGGPDATSSGRYSSFIKCNATDATAKTVSLYYNGIQTLQTLSHGITVTGDTSTTGDFIGVNGTFSGDAYFEQFKGTHYRETGAGSGTFLMSIYSDDTFPPAAPGSPSSLNEMAKIDITGLNPWGASKSEFNIGMYDGDGTSWLPIFRTGYDLDGFDRNIFWFLNDKNGDAILSSTDTGLLDISGDATITGDLTVLGTINGSGITDEYYVGPERFDIDATNTNVDAGEIEGVATVEYPDGATDGSVWVYVPWKSGWSFSSDLEFQFQYTYDVDDGTKGIYFTVDMWALDESTAIPSSGAAADTAYTDTIATASGDETKILTTTAGTITLGNADITSNIAGVRLKISRVPTNGADTYGGSFHILSMRVYQ